MCLPPCILRANVARPLTAVLRTLLPPPLSPSPASHYSPFPLPICGVAASCYTPQLHTQDTSQHMMTVRATCLLTAALCCACALVRTHEGDHDGHEKGEAGDGNGDHGNKEMTVEEVKTMCVLLKQLRGVSPSVEALVTRANNSLSTISRYKAKEDSALEEARRGGSNETVQKHESRATAVGNAYATAAAAVLSVPDLAANITAASTTIINEIVESLDDLEKSEASEEVRGSSRVDLQAFHSTPAIVWDAFVGVFPSLEKNLLFVRNAIRKHSPYRKQRKDLLRLGEASPFFFFFCFRGLLEKICELRKGSEINKAHFAVGSGKTRREKRRKSTPTRGGKRPHKKLQPGRKLKRRHGVDN
uniref:Trypanosoma glutamic acid/alanine-rich protein domain-containing protein n=1 Tax=Trypanosoma vivax (strain Y486) TaxID=1055687 RepID=G0U5B3_TRYVY